jgi:iron-sulfur cluster repair protein YtfE (RIC family)
MDLFAQLSHEHDRLRPLVAAIQTAAEVRDRSALMASLVAARTALTAELDAHIALEDEMAFPAIGEAIGAGVIMPFRVEHEEIRELRDRLLACADAGTVPPELAMQLCDLILSHMQREDDMLFPSVCEPADPRNADSCRK